MAKIVDIILWTFPIHLGDKENNLFNYFFKRTLLFISFTFLIFFPTSQLTYVCYLHIHMVVNISYTTQHNYALFIVIR